MKWCKDGIFKTAFDSIINTEYINKDIKLFIDSTFINNKYGVEDIGLNIDNKKKRASKLSIICNENKFIFSIISVKLNKNNKNKYNGFKHDVNTIQDSLNNINKAYNFKNVSLIGDKGYITKEEFKYNNKKIDLITSKRSNQKIQNNNINKRILKKRIYIENAISIIKKDERVMTSIQFRYILFIKYDLNLKTSLRFINLKRKDHNIKSYLGFVYLTCLKHNIKILNKIL